MRNCFVVASLVCLLSPFTTAWGTDLKTQVSGVSTGPGTLSRTIIDISQPPGPARLASTYTVTVPIASGSSAVVVAKALIDSINAQIGSFGFTAAFASLPDSTILRMSRASPFSSCDQGSVPGITLWSGDLLVLMQHFGHQCAALGASADRAAVASGAERVVPLDPQVAVGVPSLANCSFDPRLVVCPAGDLLFHATLRDATSSPVPGASLILSFTSCTALSSCQQPPPSYLTTQANGLGVAAIGPAMGAGCAGHQVGVYTDTGLLGNRIVASPDQDGDLDVDNNDAIILRTKVGTIDPSGDLDGDGAVSGACPTSGVPDDREPRLPGLMVQGLWPNILRPGQSATLDFSTPGRLSLVLELFDVVGRRIAAEPLGTMEPGPHRMEWRVPAGMPAGLYALRLRSSTGERSATSLVVR